MIIIDKLLEQREVKRQPIRVGLIGAGFMARGVVRQIVKYTKGMKLVGIANRTIEKAENILKEAGTDTKNILITHDYEKLIDSPDIDVIFEVTGALEYGANVITKALKKGKHVVSYNAELDATVGSVLVKIAKENGVIYTLADGDQPGVEMNLYRYVKGMGLNPLVCGNIKGLQDPYRTPTTQKAFAEKWGQNPSMVTSFADGSKISFEQACVANAIGFGVAKRGMNGYVLPPKTPVEDVINHFNYEEIKKTNGIVDYVVGAEPNGGIFVLAETDDPVQKHYLNLYKVGQGPLYCFYVPYHLCHFDAPQSIARALLFSDETLTPLLHPTVEVITVAKKDLKKGEKLDPIGHYMTYGECENTSIARKENLLPMGLAEDCVLTKDVKKDEVIRFDAVTIPEGRLIDKLWNEQFSK